ncbi:MAG: glycoside hydrolase family 25 protein [Bacteroidetes bacterium]|nr:glycoside hydrolase family 25 protein [Bacteroidota bacterium]
MKLLRYIVPSFVFLLLGTGMVSSYYHKGIVRKQVLSIKNTLNANSGWYKRYLRGITNRYPVVGIDVSHHQGWINWQKVARANAYGRSLDFAFIKATEGGSFVDRRFKRNWEEAGRSGLMRSAYHFYNPKIKSTKQVAHFARVVKLRKGDLPPVLDVEKRGTYSDAVFVQGVYNTLKAMEKQYGVKPMLYTSPKFYHRYFTQSRFKSFPVWIANYHRHSPRLKKNWKFWQVTDRAYIYGINGVVDLNVYNGKKYKLRQLCLK